MTNGDMQNRKTDARGALAKTRQRLSVAMTGLLVVFTLLMGRLFEVTVLREPSIGRSVASVNETSLYRADIVDRRGEILATDLRGASLFADGREIWDPADAARQLARVIPGLDADAVARRLSTRQAFVWIKRNISPAQQAAVRQLGLPALHFREEPRRVYPNGRTASHVLGFVNVDNHGLAGLERGIENTIIERRNKGGVVELSLDLRVQHALEDELAAAMARFQAKAAAGIVMDVNNGEILGLSSMPDFDPNEPGSGQKDALFNRATLGVFEMGSTFKLFTMAAALDAGKASIASTYDVRTPIAEGPFIIRDTHPQDRVLTMPEVLMHSSNIGTVMIARQAGADVQQAYLRRFGLLNAVPFELRESAGPLLPKNWGQIELATTSYGYGLSVSPLHVAAATAAVVNGGIHHKPTLLKRDSRADVTQTRVLLPETSARMREMMRMVVASGTGRQADVPGYPVAGKTGTAEKQVGSGYDKTRVRTSFVGVFPAKAPQYLVLVLLDEPKPTAETKGYATAGWTAAPTAGKVISRIAPMLNVPVAPIEAPATPPATFASYEELR